jgi:membrane protein implicated in regulation of membrane protease activity
MDSESVIIEIFGGNMKRFWLIAPMAFIAWSFLAYAFWTVEEAVYFVLLSVAISVLAINIKLAEPDKKDRPID